MAKAKESKDNVKRQLPKRVPPLTISRAFGQKSPLIDANLQAFLAKCLCADQWQAYSDSERGRILESLPHSRRPKHSISQKDISRTDNLTDATDSDFIALSQQYDIPTNAIVQSPLASLDLDTDSYVKRAVARFQRDLGDGYYEKPWQDKARRAHLERMEGKFDDYVKQYAETMFEDDGSLDENGNGDPDELAQVSEDGEYLDTSRNTGRGKGRPRRAE